MEFTVCGRNLKKILKKPWEIQLAVPRNQSGNKRQNMIPPRWPFPTLHAGGCAHSWRCKFPNSRQTDLQFVCSLVASPWCRGTSIKGQPGSSPHLSTHAPGATGAGTTARGNIPAHPRAIFKGTVVICPQRVAKRIKYSRCHLQARQDTS